MQKQKQQLLLMLVIGALVGVFAVKAFSGDSADNLSRDDGTTPSGATTTSVIDATPKSSISKSSSFPIPPSVPANTRVGLSVSDQAAARTVLISGLQTAETGWVAVYDEKDGAPFWILGAQKINPSDKQVTVDLLRPEGMISGKTYFAAILFENGDGVFNRLTDLPPLTPDKVTIVSFKAL